MYQLCLSWIGRLLEKNPSTDAWKAIPMLFLKSMEVSTSYSSAITIQRS